MADKPQTRSQYRNSKANNQPETQKSTGKGRRITGNVFKVVFFTVLFVAFAGIAGGATMFYTYAKEAPKLTDAKLRDPLSSKILDKNGDVYAEIGKERREYIEYKDIPKQLENAVLSTEDSRFYEHDGMDPIRLVSAAAGNITGGFGSQGASTLTQQIIKMSYLDYTNKTLSRKAQEAWMAIQLEEKYSKQELLEIYINKVYLSDGVHGMETAAEHYYGKKLKDLNLAQTALIAGMPQSPNRFNPFTHPDLAKNRRDIVLKLMYNNDKISKSDMEAAQALPITDGLVDEATRKQKTYAYDTYVDQVIDEIGDKYNPFTDGLTIYTALDPDAQKYTEKMLNTDDVINYPDKKFQAGVVVMDTTTGRVQALGGGRETAESKKVSRGLNRATDIKRQPGSTMKPILGYAPAIEYLDWSTAHILDDAPYQYSSGQELRNYDSGYLGEMSMRRALYLSRNIPAVKASKEVGYDRARDFANNLGLNYKEVYESTVIGSGEASPIQMAGAYGAFGNGGVYNQPHTVTKIVLSDGKTEVNMEPESVVAMKASTAYMISDMLKDVLTQGTGTRANIPGWNIAAKTGTTNYDEAVRIKNGIPSDGTPDSWFVGYSPRYTVSVWTGYDEPNKNYLSPSETRIAAYMFKAMMEHLVAGEKNPDFKKPSNVNEIPVIIGSNPITRAAAGASGSNISYELFLDGTVPTRTSQAEKKESDTDKDKEKDTQTDAEKKAAEEKAKKEQEAADKEKAKKDAEDAAKKAQEDADKASLQAPGGLNASYNAATKTVSASWASNGAGVTYDVSVNGQTQNYATTSISVGGGSPGSTVVITVVPVKDGKRGSPASTTVTIPAEQTQPNNDQQTTPPAGDTSGSQNNTNPTTSP